jgi:hypothetical protein
MRHWLRELPKAQAEIVIAILRGERLRQIARGRGRTPQAIQNLLERALRTAWRGGPYRQREGFIPEYSDSFFARHPHRWLLACSAWARGASHSGIATALQCSVEAAKRLLRRIRKAGRREERDLHEDAQGALAPA